MASAEGYVHYRAEDQNHEAEEARFDVRDGCLLIFDTDSLLQAYAPGSWESAWIET